MVIHVLHGTILHVYERTHHCADAYMYLHTWKQHNNVSSHLFVSSTASLILFTLSLFLIVAVAGFSWWKKKKHFVLVPDSILSVHVSHRRVYNEIRFPHNETRKAYIHLNHLIPQSHIQPDAGNNRNPFHWEACIVRLVAWQIIHSARFLPSRCMDCLRHSGHK